MAQSFGASDFVQALDKFLQQNFKRLTVHPTIHDRFNVYKSITVCLPSTPHGNEKVYRIRANPERHNGPWKPATPPHFDTVLVVNDHGEHMKGGLNGRFH